MTKDTGIARRLSLLLLLFAPLGACLLSGCQPGTGTTGAGGTGGGAGTTGAAGQTGGAGQTGAAGQTGTAGQTGAGTAGQTGAGGQTGAAGQTGAGTAGSQAGSGGGAGAGARGGSGGGAGSSARGGTGGTGAPAGTAGSAAGSAGTGGAAGGGAPPSLIGDVTFSVPSQAFRGQLSVGMTTTLSGAEIRYTTDGTLPTATSMLYAGTPLSLSASTELRATPFIGGAPGGRTSTGIYIARAVDLTSKLPIVILDSYGRYTATEINANTTANKSTYRNAGVMVFEPVNGTASLANLPTVVSRAAFHLRGQSSSGFPQKPYKVELRDNADGDARHPIAGMPADADWALIPPYYDRSLLRNPFIYTLGRDMGLRAPDEAFAEVYLNFKAAPVADADYQGIYWLSATIEINPRRNDLGELRAEDIAEPNVTGGYIFKFDWSVTDPNEPHLTCAQTSGVTCWTDCELTDPHPLPAPTQQLAWITRYVQTFHNTLFTTPIGDYRQHIDVASFIDYLIINELSRNTDGLVRSAYYHKPRGKPLAAGPLWDYNFSLGVGAQPYSSATPMGTNDGGWLHQGRTAGSLPSRNVNSWYPKMMADPTFQTAVRTRWKALRQGLLSQAQIASRLSALAAQLPPEAITRDYALWSVSRLYPNGGPGGTVVPVYSPTAATWDGQVQALRDWINARATWIDSQWP